jgi:hypothetical protein
VFGGAFEPTLQEHISYCARMHEGIKVKKSQSNKPGANPPAREITWPCRSGPYTRGLAENRRAPFKRRLCFAFRRPNRGASGAPPLLPGTRFRDAVGKSVVEHPVESARERHICHKQVPGLLKYDNRSSDNASCLLQFALDYAPLLCGLQRGFCVRRSNARPVGNRTFIAIPAKQPKRSVKRRE